MSRWKRTVVTVTCVWLVAGAALAAPPAQQVYSTKGMGGNANIFGFSGCRNVSLSFAASESSSHQAGGPPVEGMPYFWGTYSWFDPCTFQNGWGFMSGGDVTVGGNGVERVTISGSVALTECTLVWDPNGFPTFQCTPRQVALDVALQADGQWTSQGQSNNFYSNTYGALHIRSKGSQASATVSGSVLIDGVEVLGNVFMSSGAISRSQSGQITMYRYN